jgi:hypothetical protein
VLPSAAALAARLLPTLPAAPGRLSTVTGWPNWRLMTGASWRASESAADPPETLGTIQRIG